MNKNTIKTIALTLALGLAVPAAQANFSTPIAYVTNTISKSFASESIRSIFGWTAIGTLTVAMGLDMWSHLFPDSFDSVIGKKLPASEGSNTRTGGWRNLCRRVATVGYAWVAYCAFKGIFDPATIAAAKSAAQAAAPVAQEAVKTTTQATIEAAAQAAVVPVAQEAVKTATQATIAAVAS